MNRSDTTVSPTVLLTGGLGYIGSHCAVVLHEAGFRVVLVDNLSNARVEVVDALAEIMGERPAFVEGDIRDTELMVSVLQTHDVSAVMHFAGLKAVGESVEKPLDYFDCNVGGTVSLLQAMEASGVHRLVFSSSATVYGAPVYLPMDEAHPKGPTNPYGQTKLQIEQILEAVCAKPDSKWQAVCLRYFNPVGAHESGLIGENPNQRPNNLMPFITQVAAGRLDELSVFGDDYETPDGTGVRDYIHVMDLASGHLAALAHLNKLSLVDGDGSKWLAINLGTGQGVSVLEMVRAFERATGVAVPYRFGARREGDVPSYWADPNEARSCLGWEAQLDVEAMCRSAWGFESALRDRVASEGSVQRALG